MANELLPDIIERANFLNSFANVFSQNVKEVYDNNFSLTGLGGHHVKYENFVIIGAGGTGSWFAPKFVKILNDSVNKGLLQKAEVLFIDGDSVESKNTIRQNFVDADVGKNKAAVLAERYGVHSDSRIHFGYVDKYIVKEPEHIPAEHSEMFCLMSDVFKGLGHGRSNALSRTLAINLIDNGKTRKNLHLFATLNSLDVIDVANNEFNGQLNFTANKTEYSSGSAYGLIASRFYNDMPEQLGENDDIAVFSCADADAEAVDQMFNANDMAASVLGNFINDIIVNKKVTYGKVSFVTGSNISIEKSYPLFPVSFSNNCSHLDNIISTYGSRVVADIKTNSLTETSTSYVNFMNKISSASLQRYFQEYADDVSTYNADREEWTGVTVTVPRTINEISDISTKYADLDWYTSRVIGTLSMARAISETLKSIVSAGKATSEYLDDFSFLFKSSGGQRALNSINKNYSKYIDICAQS